MLGVPGHLQKINSLMDLSNKLHQGCGQYIQYGHAKDAMNRTAAHLLIWQHAESTAATGGWLLDTSQQAGVSQAAANIRIQHAMATPGRVSSGAGTIQAARAHAMQLGSASSAATATAARAAGPAVAAQEHRCLTSGATCW